ncbi:hypothetical protein RJ641_031305 [Dillenia turbinata]|uniref:Uncharacterized protein n=1 Tax=Dillenia turbinata TaxID=194707 RepID=A0AAN8W2B1_9MAGN
MHRIWKCLCPARVRHEPAIGMPVAHVEHRHILDQMSSVLVSLCTGSIGPEKVGFSAHFWLWRKRMAEVPAESMRIEALF